MATDPLGVGVSRRLPDEDLWAFQAANLSGMTVYDTPTPCKQCGGCARYASTRQCVTCMRARSQANPKPRVFQGYPKTRKEAIALGVAYFHPRRPCIRLHRAKRDVATNSCYRCRYPERK